MDSNQYQFLLEEYKSLKAEIEYRVKATERIEYVAIVAVAAIYAWIVQLPKEAHGFIWWAPCLFPIVGLVRHFGLIKRLLDIGEYLREIEKVICVESPKGWEHFLKKKREGGFTATMISSSSYVLWVLLLLVTIYAGINQGFR